MLTPYRILECLGGGAMGVVYKAEDSRLQRTVAIKFLPPDLTRDPEAKERFLQEARLASSLDHPNLCTIYEVGESETGQLYLAMAFYDGENLKKRIERGPLPVADALEIAAQIASGLSRAHASGIIHRDVKPANVMLTSRGEVKLVDFGLAKLMGEMGINVTRDGALMGTPAYMSPEQAQGKPIDIRTDVWSLGVVLYEMLTGARPFTGEAWQAVIQAVISKNPEPVRRQRPEVPAALERIVQKCLAKKPADRYATIEDLAADLNALRTPAQSSFGSWSRAIAPVRPTKRSWRWMAVLGILLLLGGSAYVGLRQLPRSPPAAKGEEPAVRSDAALVTDGRKMIVVLPFDNLGDPQDAYFSEGITEEITSRLAAIQGLGVISRTSASKYRGSGKSLPQIAGELNVDYVLEGTVRWEHSSSGPSRVRVTPQLIKVPEDTHLWSERYDREIGEIFKVQSEIAAKVITQLNVTLLQAERQALQGRPTASAEAYQAYLKGRSRLTSLVPGSKKEGEEAVALFNEAIRLDPGFALAYASLSRAHSSLYQGGFDVTPERLDLARQAADRALELQPDLPEGHLALGYYHYWGHRAYDRALAEFDQVERVQPNNTEVLEALGYMLRRQGRLQEAVKRLRRAFVLDPRNSFLATNVGNTYTILRQYQLAEDYFELAISLDPQQAVPYVAQAVNIRLWKGDAARARAYLEAAPTKAGDALALETDWIDQNIQERRFGEALRRIESLPRNFVRNQEQVYPRVLLEGHVFRFLGRQDEARRAYEEARRLLADEVRRNPRDARLQSSLGMALAGLGRRQEAMRAAGVAVELSPMSNDAVSGVHRLLDLARVYTMVGEQEAALDQIEYLLSIPAPLSRPMLRLDPFWDPLRNSPRFQALVRAR
ncbi:MAG TPA: protein kinase [Thermoanaerobaculia bacterium]|nr:protein kinase [Thermoanaerobaculia bacterium]